MANGFSKQEVVAFDQMLEGFNDAIVATKMAYVYKTDQTTMERAGDTIWRPQPYIMTSYQGAPNTDQTENFKDVTQLSVPVSITTQDTVPWTLTATQLRDMLQEGRLGQAAKDKVASDINIALLNTAVAYGSLVIKQTVAASGYNDISLAEASMDELGIGRSRRVMGIAPRDYNLMAGNLAARQTVAGKVQTAYEEALIGNNVAGFQAWKLNYGKRLAAAAGVGVTINGANQFYTPAATTLAANGTPVNVDNRFQNINITVTSGAVAVGDCFTIAGVDAVHHITKQDTGQLKTFRVTGIVSGAGGTGTITITPPIISGQGATNAEAMYQNVTATPAAGAAVTFLNTAASTPAVFWEGEAMEIIPGRLSVPEDSGLAVIRGTTDDGIELVMTKQTAIGTLKTQYRVDSYFGTACKNPELAGIELFNQV
jgi:hypothetical protein